jgi:hypothetical protein
VIHFSALDYTTNNGNGETVYSWENPDAPYGVRMWAIDRMNKWCQETNREVLASAVDSDRAEWFINNRGIERHRVDWLLRTENRHNLMNPCLMMRMKRSALSAEGDHWDLMLDGHHRYVSLALLQRETFRLWHLTEEEAKAFEIYGHPQPVGGLNIDAFSGLGVDR